MSSQNVFCNAKITGPIFFSFTFKLQVLLECTQIPVNNFILFITTPLKCPNVKAFKNFDSTKKSRDFRWKGFKVANSFCHHFPFKCHNVLSFSRSCLCNVHYLSLIKKCVSNGNTSAPIWIFLFTRNVL